MTEDKAAAWKALYEQADRHRDAIYDELAEVKAENAKLRDALTRIKQRPRTCGIGADSVEWLENILKIADAALTGDRG